MAVKTLEQISLHACLLPVITALSHPGLAKLHKGE